MSSTIKAAIQALKGRIADAYTAIVAKGGTLPATQDSANLPSAIASIPSGGGEEGGGIYHDKYPINDIIFTDHTGSIFYSCSIAEAQQMTEMPEAPTYDKLIFDTYTHTLTQIQDGMPHVIGAVYKTIMDTKYGVADILYMKVVASAYNKSATIQFPNISLDYKTEIDWGDGTIDVAHNAANTHIYSDIGEYDVILRRTGTRADIDAIFSHNARVVYMSSWSDATQRISLGNDNTLEEIMVPASFVSANNYWLNYYTSVKAIIGSRLTFINNIADLKCTGARFLVLPNAQIPIFNIDRTEFASMPNLEAIEAYSVSKANCIGKITWISIKSGTTLPNYFLRANNTKKAWLPSTITSFPSEVFGYNGNTIVELHIAAATPPTLPNSNSPYLASGAIIYVPSGSKSAYEASTNWAAVASRYSATFVEE